jgi:hypothetical protein
MVPEIVKDPSEPETIFRLRVTAVTFAVPITV